jgi:hypothetical protein
MRTFLTSVVGLLPPGRTKNRLLCLLGHTVAATADIRPVLLLPGTTLEVGERAIIGTLSTFRGVRVVLAEAAEIGQLNWVTAAPELVRESTQQHRAPSRSTSTAPSPAATTSMSPAACTSPGSPSAPASARRS